MLRSLRSRLLLTVGLAVVLAVGSVSLVSSRTTRKELEHFLLRSAEAESLLAHLEAASGPLVAHYREHGGWRGVEPVLEDALRRPGPRHGGVLADAEGAVVAASTPELRAAGITVLEEGLLELRRRRKGEAGRDELFVLKTPAVPLESDGRRLGTLYHAPLFPGGEEPSEHAFLASVNRSLLAAAAVAGVLALGVTAWLTRRILRPVEELTAAVQRLQTGDLGSRVEPRGRDEVSELARAFNAMAEGLARIESLRRAMVGDIAHELRTPLTNLRAQVEALQDGLLEADRAALGSLHEEVMLLGRLVDDLMQLALAEAGQLRLDRRPVAMPEELRRTVEVFASRSAAAGVSLELDLPCRSAEESAAEVSADPERLRQVLGNLLGNALRHTPAGGRIVLGARTVEGEVRVTVRDNGPGVPQEHLAQLFERFYRTDASRGRSTGGAGLGLAIVRQLVALHGGRVWAESPPGGGALFGFALPRRQQDDRC